MRYGEALKTYDRGLEYSLIVTSPGDKDKGGLSYRLHYRETLAPNAAQNATFCRSQPVHIDRLVSYALVLLLLVIIDCYAGD